MQTLSWNIRKAIKEHKCDYCQLPITKGIKYINQGIENDGLYTWKCHIDCHELIEELGWFNYSYDGFTSDDFIQSVHEAYKEVWHIPDILPVTFADKLTVLKHKHLEHA